MSYLVSLSGKVILGLADDEGLIALVKGEQAIFQGPEVGVYLLPRVESPLPQVR